MKSKYMDINRIEFIITWQCGGKCRHCQMGDSINMRGAHRHVLPEYATEAVKKIASVCDVKSVMTFGGEPLYYPEVTTAIHKVAKACGIATRQLITNGYFTNNAEKSRTVAHALTDVGVNSLLLSIDAFHQEHIPIAPVYQFAHDIIHAKIPGAVLYPTWLVNAEHQNAYNAKTRDILKKFSNLPIAVGGHKNNVILLGQAANLLRGYYEKTELNLSEHRCSELLTLADIAIVPNGNVMACGFPIGNIYQEDVLDIIARYNPYENEAMLAMVQGGVSGLRRYAEKQGVAVDALEYCDACDLCGALTKHLEAQNLT